MGPPPSDPTDTVRPLARGILVTFEGGEGTGKSTQVARLQASLEGDGREVVATREPGGSPRAELIRAFLLCGDAKPFGPLAETMLFAAARADHVAHTIAPALARGAVVLCDRFIDSTRVYQGAVAGESRERIAALEHIALGSLRPDLTLILDLPAETGLARAAARRDWLGQAPDRFEDESLAFHGRVRDAFLAIAAAEPARCAVVDASGAPDEVAARVREVVRNTLRSAAAVGEG